MPGESGEISYVGATVESLVQSAGSHEAAFDALAGHIVDRAVSSGYVPDEHIRDAAELLTTISRVAEDRGDAGLNDLVGVAAELWEDPRTNESFSFGVEIVKRDGRYVVWRPQ